MHRGFLYQHLYAVGCLLRMASACADAVVVERDEDIEVVLPDRHVYVQVKTRANTLEWSDLRDAVDRFTRVRQEHSQGRRSGSPRLVVASNAAPGAPLLKRMASESWPDDVVVCWPGHPDPTLDSTLPPPWRNIPTALRWCTTVAAELPFASLPAETLVLKLAACAQYAAAGGHQHRFEAAELPKLLEFLVVQLQDFPAPPSRYRGHTNEPGLDASDRVRLMVGLSGAGKTAWASQAALHSSSPVAYFDVGDLPGSAVASSLARELAARFLRTAAGGGGGARLPADSGLNLLRALDRWLSAEGLRVTVVLDNVHRLGAADLRQVVEAAPGLRFVMIGQPWSGQTLLEAWLGRHAETLEGWPLDAVVAEFAVAGCRIDAATGERIIALTAGVPLYVQNSASMARTLYDGDAARFCSAVEKQSHTTATAQEAILHQAFERLSVEARIAAALLGLANLPLTSDETVELLTTTIRGPQVTAAALRELARHGLTQTFHGGHIKLHDAFRPLAHAYLHTLETPAVDHARETLRDLLFRSLQKTYDLSRFGLWIRLLAATYRTDTLIDLATQELFHEVGDPSELKAVLQAAADSADLAVEDRFWALDALVFWDYQDGELAHAPERVERMERLIAAHGLGMREELALRMKQIMIAGKNQDHAGIEAAFTDASRRCRDDPMLLRILRYNRANALYHADAHAEAEDAAWDLVSDYYDHLGLDPDDVLGKNPQEILAVLPHTPTRDDDFKHLADCLDLYAMAREKHGLHSGLARVHAMKFYVMAAAWRSAVRTGQDLADEFIDHGDPEGARQIIEAHLLPILRQLPATDLLVAVRAQYAVILAWCGDIEAARAEMTALDAYDVPTKQRLEMQGQRALIERIATHWHGLPPPPA